MRDLVAAVARRDVWASRGDLSAQQIVSNSHERHTNGVREICEFAHTKTVGVCVYMCVWPGDEIAAFYANSMCINSRAEQRATRNHDRHDNLYMIVSMALCVTPKVDRRAR